MKRKNQQEVREDNGIFEQHKLQTDSPPVCETIVEWLEKGRTRRGDFPALHFGSQHLNYSQLHQQSNSVAHYLIGKGIQKGDRVGICLDRSIEMVVCMIGIFKSGAVFVPLDPNYPKDRIRMMKEDTSLDLLIMHHKFSGYFGSTIDNIVFWEYIEDRIHSYSDENPPVSVEKKDVAYIVFTSGSTGRPKGIVMPHRALANVVESQIERNYFQKEAKLLQYSSISVDVSFQGIITTLASGGSVYLVKDNEFRDSRILLQKLNEFHIERLFIPYVALRSLIEVAVTTRSIPVNLREVITAGEQLQVDASLRMFFSELPEDSILDNQYGASETHVISSNVLKDDPEKWPDFPSIGTPMKNSGMHVLDKNMQPAKEGDTGEIYLAGPNLAYGYLGRDDLTKKSFIENPFQEQDKPILYKTGDLGSYAKDGSIEFMGRSDDQIKIRGYRVEPGEINSVGVKFSGVAQCFTHVFLNTAEKPQLITYFTEKNGSKVNKEAFQSHLAKLLPDYMVPSFIVKIKKIPYTPSGKIDFKALPKPQDEILETKKDEQPDYKSETEARLAQIWKDLLDFEPIPRTESFFDLGGDSLLATTLFLRIENEFGKILPLSTLIHTPTLETLSRRIEDRFKGINNGKFRCLRVIQPGNKNEIPLFLVHGGGGNVLMFRDLAESLDADIPVFAFQWPGWDGGRGPADILEMAKCYKKELRQAWPSGPYRIGGHCIGGVIALELARMLRAEGAEIWNPILVTDSPNLHSIQYRTNEPYVSDKEFLAFKKTKYELMSRIPDSEGQSQKDARKNKIKINEPTGIRKMVREMPYFSFIKRRVKTFSNRIKLLIRDGSNEAIRFKFWCMLQLSKPVPVPDRQKYAGTSGIHAIKKHKKRVYNVDILYLRSKLLFGRRLGLRGWWNDVFMGFGELCSGHFDAHVIGGGHNDIFESLYALKLIREKMFSEKSSKQIKGTSHNLPK